MRFVDEVEIQVKAGSGGDGSVAFRREKFREKGGPSGGDGGRGGSVVLEASNGLTTLLELQFRPLHHARDGGMGLGSDCNGKDSADVVVSVPVGTMVFDAGTREPLADLSEDGARWVAARGGRGGLGNMNFATATRQAPRFAKAGVPGEERALLLELKLLADVGVVGLPNAGKSSLVARVSRARPKVADYPFTTLSPHLGVVSYRPGLSFVIADIPGLVEGASVGVGLGHQFLRHIERCRVLIHLVDLSAPSPLRAYRTVQRELHNFSPALATKPQVVAANKLDLPDARRALAGFTRTLAKEGVRVVGVSTATGQGADELLDRCAEILFSTPKKKRSARR